MTFKQVFDRYKDDFNKYRKLYEYGVKVLSVVECLPEETQKEVTRLYEEGNINGIKEYLKCKRRL